MYTIIGGDGREYGPVTADQVRTWVAGGRANKDTKVKIAGTEAWKTVADFPELTGGASPAELTQPPMALSPAPLSPRPAASFDVMSCYERSWTLLKANFWQFVGASLVMFLIYGLLILIQGRTHGVISFFLGGPWAAASTIFTCGRSAANPPRSATSLPGSPGPLSSSCWPASW